MALLISPEKHAMEQARPLEFRLSQNEPLRHERVPAMVLLAALKMRGKERATVSQMRQVIREKEQVKV